MKFTKAARPVIMGQNGMVSSGHPLGALVPFLGQVLEPVAVEAEHAGLGAGEERRAEDEKDQQAEQVARMKVVQGRRLRCAG